MKHVIAELIMDSVLYGVGGGLGSADILGHSVVDPAEDALVYHCPL